MPVPMSELDQVLDDIAGGTNSRCTVPKAATESENLAA
jgi:hypothetical protein